MNDLTVNQDYLEKYGFHEEEKAIVRTDKGLNEEIIKQISAEKGEPEWMLNERLKAFKIFLAKKLPAWGGDLSKIDFDNITYYLKASDNSAHTWEDVPEEVKRTFDKLGIPEAEQKFLGGVGAQFESESVYHSLKEDLAKQGVIFTDMDTALKEHSEIVKKYFGTVIPAGDNKFSALNTSVWSGGSFVYVPAGVKVDLPLQAYFRINAKNMGQFERTLIVAEEGAEIHYIEGCTAPVYSSDSLHGAVVEVIAHKNAKIRYTTIQNWSGDVYNLVTKRAVAYENATVEWIDGNLGCLTSDTKVFLNSDVKRIADITNEDTVFSVNDKFNLDRFKVLGKKYSGKQKVYELRTTNHRTIKATANHPFLSLQKRGKFSFLQWTPLEKLKKGDLVAISGKLPECGEPRKLRFSTIGKKEITLPRETTEDLLWLLGVYAGDGYCDKSRVYFAVPEGDKACPDLVRILRDTFGVQGERKGVVLRIASVDFVRYLIVTLGFNGNANTKRIPAWVYRLPQTQRRAFVDGYISADGHYRANHKNRSITSCNEELLYDTKILAMTCGLDPGKISTWSRKEKKPLGKVEKEYTHHFLYFAEHEFKNDLAFVPVADITPFGEEDTWDIEVEGSHNFIANGFLVHNSKLTMKYPSVLLKGKGAKADILSVAYSGKGQHQDAGAKVIHLAPDTTSRIVSKSVSKDGGRGTYRGLLRIAKGATNSTASVQCDALLLDDISRSDTYPTNKIEEQDATVSHEAYVGKVGEEQLFYLMSRGLSESEALAMIVLGFIAEFTKELPMEYAIELNKLIRLEMEGM